MTAPKSPADLSRRHREAYEERAAILEFDANYTRDEAEHRAFLEALNPHPWRDRGLDYEPPNGGRYVPADWIV